MEEKKWGSSEKKETRASEEKKPLLPYTAHLVLQERDGSHVAPLSDTCQKAKQVTKANTNVDDYQTASRSSGEQRESMQDIAQFIKTT